jgi:hypothetical protein
MFDLTKREILTIVGALVIICGLTAWGTVFVIKKYVIGIGMIRLRGLGV